jgi:hypothetical protein
LWNIDLIKVQQYYEKQVSLRGGNIRKEEVKRRKSRWIWLMNSVYKNEYRIFKLVETSIRRWLR